MPYPPCPFHAIPESISFFPMCIVHGRGGVDSGSCHLTYDIPECNEFVCTSTFAVMTFFLLSWHIPCPAEAFSIATMLSRSAHSLLLSLSLSVQVHLGNDRGSLREVCDQRAADQPYVEWEIKHSYFMVVVWYAYACFGRDKVATVYTNVVAFCARWKNVRAGPRHFGAQGRRSTRYLPLDIFEGQPTWTYSCASLITINRSTDGLDQDRWWSIFRADESWALLCLGMRVWGCITRISSPLAGTVSIVIPILLLLLAILVAGAVVWYKKRIKG